MFILVLIVSVLVAVVPIVGYLTFIWWLDRYEREPIWLVIVTFLWGALGGTIGAIVVSGTLQLGVDAALGRARNSREISAAIGAVVLAPLVEEATKGLILLILLLSKQFDNSTDGLIYGAATGLGFAMTENFLYFLTVYQQGGAKAWVGNMIIRTLFSAVVHCCASGAFGFFLGLSRYRQSFLAKLLLFPIGYLAGISVHAFWNGSMTIGGMYQGGGVFTFGAFVILPCIAIGLLVIGQISLHVEHKLLRRELEEEEKNGFIPPGHAAILPYWLKRRKSGWMPANVPQEKYVQVATKLAFRKSQVRVRGKKRGEALLKEVEELRKEVVRLVLGDRSPLGTTRRTETAYMGVPIQYPPTGGQGPGPGA